MKSRADLLVRDALAERFVLATSGDFEARKTLDALARWAQADAWAESTLEELVAESGQPLFVAGLLAPEFASREGWVRDRAPRFAAALEWIAQDGLAGRPVECALAAWDAGLFFEVHEILEPVWLEAQGPRRDILQGLIMAGAALHHLVEGNLAGARGLLREASRRLQPAGGWEGHDLESFGGALAQLAQRIDAGELRGAADLDDVPRVERADS